TPTGRDVGGTIVAHHRRAGFSPRWCCAGLLSPERAIADSPPRCEKHPRAVLNRRRWHAYQTHRERPGPRARRRSRDAAALGYPGPSATHGHEVRLRHAAAELRARELQMVPDSPEQRHLGIDVELAGLAVHGEFDRHANASGSGPHAGVFRTSAESLLSPVR